MPQLSLATPPTSYTASSATPTPALTATSPLSPPTPMMRPTSQSFSLQRPLLAQDAKKTRNSKRLSLLVPPSPGKLETLASMAAAASPSLQTPSTPSTSSFSARRAFASAPISVPLSTLPQATVAPTRNQSHLLPDQPLLTSRLSTNTSTMPSSSRRPISAYYSDFSAECGVASPYTSAPVCVLPHLYLGAEHNALDVNMLSRLGITSVLNVAVEIATAASEESRSLEPSAGTRNTTTSTIGDSKIVYTSQGTIIHYKNLSWTHHQKNLKDEFPVAFKFIEETRSLGGKVLVHCQLGVSRSASLVIAYVMKTRQLGLSDAYEFVKTRSGVISPNMSLMYQLAEFEKSLKDRPTAPMSRAGSKHAHASPEDDEDVYPYPTDRMDIDRDEDSPQDALASSRRLSQTMLASAASDSQSRRRSTSKRATLVLSRPGTGSPTADPTVTSMVNTRPRSPHYGSSFAPLSSDPSTMTVPRTPMTDRFSFSSFVPATPPTPTKSFSNKARFEPLQLQQLQENEEYQRSSSSPIAGTCTFDPSSHDVVMDSPSTPNMLSPPVPPFFPSSSFRRQPASLASSASSFRTSIPSRPSSTSSASSSTSIAHCGSDELTPAKEDAMDAIMPDTPTTPSHASNSSNKKAMIHSLATVLTRRFSGRFHGQPVYEGSNQSDVQYRPSDATMEQGSIRDDAAEAAADKCGADEFSQETKSPEFVFSPRPCSPPLLEAHTFGEFYQALRM
ncbi:hypothetical protein BGZ67_009188 [Mortierella alpina]|nr:hypothetical protein BGZ67_009188 [Mortierella alpina]